MTLRSPCCRHVGQDAMVKSKLSELSHPSATLEPFLGSAGPTNDHPYHTARRKIGPGFGAPTQNHCTSSDRARCLHLTPLTGPLRCCRDCAVRAEMSLHLLLRHSPSSLPHLHHPFGVSPPILHAPLFDCHAEARCRSTARGKYWGFSLRQAPNRKQQGKYTERGKAFIPRTRMSDSDAARPGL
jgi:hypothetical protein